MQWFKDIREILDQEPENWLAYLHGQQLDNIPHLTRKKPKFRGLFFIFLKFIYFNVRHLSLRPGKKISAKVDFFIFAGTENQMSSLDSTAEGLKGKGASVIGIANKNQINSKLRRSLYRPLCLSIGDIIKSIVLLSFRAPKLGRLVQNNYSDVKDWCLGHFIQTYPYLVYFYKTLSETNPEYIIVSNDHNVPNRCLLAVAHHLNIKTVYLQHASVSNLFPALRVNYAFLDGQCALETYQICESNQPDTNRTPPSPTILLSGQKKTLPRKKEGGSAVVGFALNALDSVPEAIRLAGQLTSAGYKVCVRWHPGQARAAARLIQDDLGSNENISFSDPNAESVGIFLKKVSWLIAGNSSIHLEAALAGVLPIYFELTPPDNPDYYGYAKHGLAKYTETANDILTLLAVTKQCHHPDVDAVRYYSATYLSEWDGKEGDLVAECLIRISKGKELPVTALNLVSDKINPHKRQSSSRAMT